MNNMALALQITALGMGLVFAAIILLWWMMNLLTVITADKEPASGAGEDSSEITAAVMDDELKAQAVAVAVAMALAEQQVSTPHVLTEPPPGDRFCMAIGHENETNVSKGKFDQTPCKIG